MSDTTGSKTTALKLAEFVSAADHRDIPESALDMAVRCVQDLISAAVAGFNTQGVRAVCGFGRGFFPSGPAAVWFSPQRFSPSGAAFINSAAASALDLDDGNRSAGGHPGASIIPACLAYAESLGSHAHDFLTAVVLGYEVAVRVAAARDFSLLDTVSTGRWCGYGASAAACRLIKSSPLDMARAMSVAGTHAPLQSAAAYSRQGHATKEGIPWATLTALAGVELAQRGYSGPLDILDHPDYFSSGRILKGLGDTWAIEQTYFKDYSCCRWIHPALDGLVALMTEYGLTGDDLQAMEVRTFGRALGLKNETDPPSLEGAQFSLPYCLALVAVKGPDSLRPIRPDLLGLEKVIALARQVRLVLDPKMESGFPMLSSARLNLRTRKGNVSRLVEHPRGDPANPMTSADMENKFQHLVAGRLSAAKQNELTTAFERLKTGELAPLLTALRSGRLLPGEDV